MISQKKKARNGWRALIAGLTSQSCDLERTPAIAVSNLPLNMYCYMGTCLNAFDFQ